MKSLLIFTIIFAACFGKAWHAKASDIDGINQHYKDLMGKSFDEIMQNYTIVPDFSIKETTRPIGNYTFWSYPFKIPPWAPKLAYSVENIEEELPKTIGVGRAVEHLNKGRILYLQGKYKQARDTWLSARARYGGNNPKWLRRCLYFIGLGLLKMAEELGDPRNLDDAGINLRETHYGNAALFLSEAFVLRKTPEDTSIDKYKTKVLSQLSNIYYVFKRYSSAFASAQEGLDQVRITGITKYRAPLLKMMAESMIRNRSYYEAVDYLDTLIRTTLDRSIAAESFSRMGDIYFDLNNYELAEAMYGLSLAVDRQKAVLSPWQSILRGESLFWMKRHEESIKMLRLGIEASRNANSIATLPGEAIAFAKLRQSDNYLVAAKVDPLQLYSNIKNNQEVLVKLGREYYSVEHEHPTTQAAEIASLRRYCIEDLSYQKNNIRHARIYLKKIKNSISPENAKEFAHACYVKSFSARSFQQGVIKEIQDFFKKYPYSKYLTWMTKSLIRNRRMQLDDYINKNKLAEAIIFHKRYKNQLFEELTSSQNLGLFKASVSLERASEAHPYWNKEKEQILKSYPMLSLVYAVETNRSPGTVQSILDYLDAKNYKIPNDLFHRNLGNRIWVEQSDTAKAWYFSRLQDEDMETSRSKLFCSFVFPKLADAVSSDSEDLSLSGISYMVYLIERTFPLWLQDDPGCAVDILNLEVRLNEELIVATWLGRLDWPADDKTLRYYWIAAETAREAGDLASASKLWQWVDRNAKNDSPYKRYASSRLTPVKSELDQLWK